MNRTPVNNFRYSLFLNDDNFTIQVLIKPSANFLSGTIILSETRNPLETCTAKNSWIFGDIAWTWINDGSVQSRATTRPFQKIHNQISNQHERPKPNFFHV